MDILVLNSDYINILLGLCSVLFCFITDYIIKTLDGVVFVEFIFIPI